MNFFCDRSAKILLNNIDQYDGHAAYIKDLVS